MPSKPPLTKRARSNSHGQRVSVRGRRSAPKSCLKAPPPSSQMSVGSTSQYFPFTFSLPEYSSTWLSLRENLERGSSPKKCDPATTELKFESIVGSLATNLTQLRVSSWITSSSKGFRFLYLPREIRDLIYTFAVADAALVCKPPEETPERPNPIHIFFKNERPGHRIFLSRIDSSTCALLATCRLVFSEALPIFFQLNQFYVRGVMNSSAISRLHPMAYNNITRLEINLARSARIRYNLVPIFSKLLYLPKLQKACIERFSSASPYDRAVHEHWDSGSTGCSRCADRGKASTQAMLDIPLFANRLRIDITILSNRDASADEVIPCLVCALVKNLSETEFDRREQDVIETLISLSVYRRRCPIKEQPSQSSNVGDLVLLPRLENEQSLHRHRRQF